MKKILLIATCSILLTVGTALAVKPDNPDLSLSMREAFFV